MKKAVGEERYSPAVVLRKYSIYLVSIGTPEANDETAEAKGGFPVIPVAVGAAAAAAAVAAGVVIAKRKRK